MITGALIVQLAMLAAPPQSPPDGVYAVGRGDDAPLPAPPVPVDPKTIRKGAWRGLAWIGGRLTLTAPVGGSGAARTHVIAISAGLEAGLRVNQWLGVGMGFSRQPHETREETFYDAALGTDVTTVRIGRLSAWDTAIVRLFVPVKGRLQPYVDVAGGLAVLSPALRGPNLYGAHLRGSAGFDAWITRHLTLGTGLTYRATFLTDVGASGADRDSVGHALQGFVEFAVHW